ncbi:MAG: hypothetical protein ACE5OY_08335 [Candidatus Bathyarchaeia archaeon]
MVVTLLTSRQRIIAKLRESMTQTEVARRLGTSQANVAKIERSMSDNIGKAMGTIREADEMGFLYGLRLRPNPLENAFEVLRFSARLYMVTGVSGQWLLVGYYKLGDEIELRSDDPVMRKLWNARVYPLGELSLRPASVEGLVVAPPELVVVDSLLRRDAPGLKSGMAMLMQGEVDFTLLRRLAERSSASKLLDEVIGALATACSGAGLRVKLPHKDVEAGELVTHHARKVVDDFAPFLLG